MAMTNKELFELIRTREKRIEEAKAFLDTHEVNGELSYSDQKTYENIQRNIGAMTTEIDWELDREKEAEIKKKYILRAFMTVLQVNLFLMVRTKTASINAATKRAKIIAAILLMLFGQILKTKSF